MSTFNKLSILKLIYGTLWVEITKEVNYLLLKNAKFKCREIY